MVIKILDPDWIRIRIKIGIQPKMLDLDPESVNSDQKDFFQYIFFKKCLNIIVNCVKKEESVVDSELEPKAQFRVYRYRTRYRTVPQETGPAPHLYTVQLDRTVGKCPDFSPYPDRS